MPSDSPSSASLTKSAELLAKVADGTLPDGVSVSLPDDARIAHGPADPEFVRRVKEVREVAALNFSPAEGPIRFFVNGSLVADGEDS